jgi:hypothetical protein
MWRGSFVTRQADLQSLLASVRCLAASRENAQRLLTAYERAYRTDEDLGRLTGSVAETAIDGFTEPRTVQDFEQLLAMPDTVAIEIPVKDSLQETPLAMAIVPFATSQANSIDRFRQYYLGDVFDPSALTFHSREAWEDLEEALTQGNVIYPAEMVSIGSRTATMALLVAIQILIAERILGQPQVTVLGKCLDTVTLQTETRQVVTNQHGNRRIKWLAQSLGLQQIATADQSRVLAPAQPGYPTRTARLTFGLYLGHTAARAAQARTWERFLPTRCELARYH